MDTCPHCRRKLLSHISARCNWCGVEITDAAYLAQADVERAAFRAEDALHSLQSLTIRPVAEPYSRYGQVSALLGRYTLSQQDAMSAQRMDCEVWEQARQAAELHAQQQKAAQQAQAEETPAAQPTAEAGDRFGHLEL